MNEKYESKLIVDGNQVGIISCLKGTTFREILAGIPSDVGLDGYGPGDLEVQFQYLPDQEIDTAPDTISITRVSDPTYVHAFPSVNVPNQKKD